MKIIALPIIIVLFFSASFVGWQTLTQQGSFVVGGEYVVHSGEVVRGNLQALFAQVTLDDGARVDGQIVSVSSALDLAGSVSGDILSIGSDITVRATAQLRQDPRQLETLHYVVLLPEMARVGPLSQR